MNDLALFFYALFGIACLAWSLALTSRLADIRNEARKHTALLAQTARQTAPPASPTAKGSAGNYRIPGLS